MDPHCTLFGLPRLQFLTVECTIAAAVLPPDATVGHPQAQRISGHSLFGCCDEGAPAGLSWCWSSR